LIIFKLFLHLDWSPRQTEVSADDADQSRTHEEEGAAAELRDRIKNISAALKVQELGGLLHSFMKKSGTTRTL